MSNNIYSVLWHYNRYPWIMSPSYKILKNGRKIRSNSWEIHPRIRTLSLRSEWVSLLLHSCSERKLQLLDWCLTPTLPGTTHPSLDHCPTSSPGPSTPPETSQPTLDQARCSGTPTLPWTTYFALDNPPCPGSTTPPWTTYPALDQLPHHGPPTLPWTHPSAQEHTHTHTRPRSPTLPWTTPVSFFKPIEVNSSFCVYYFIFDVQT